MVLVQQLVKLNRIVACKQPDQQLIVTKRKEAIASCGLIVRLCDEAHPGNTFPASAQRSAINHMGMPL